MKGCARYRLRGVIVLLFLLSNISVAGSRKSDKKVIRSFSRWTSGSWITGDSVPLRLSLPPGKGKGRGFFEATPFNSTDGLSPLHLRGKKYRIRRRGKILKLSGSATWARATVRRIGGPNWTGTFAITAKKRGRSRLIVSGSLRTSSDAGLLTGRVATKTGGGYPPVSDPWMEMVLVGNQGNGPDAFEPIFPTTVNGPLGAVAYVFMIGKYEVTNGQYAEFLNSVAASDPNGIYNPLMGSNARGGIFRANSDPNYTYSPKPNMADKPVTFVSFWDACRFCNWLHNSRPSGPQTDATTENGAYTLTTQAMSSNSVYRNPEAKYFCLPRTSGIRQLITNREEDTYGGLVQTTANLPISGV